MKKPAEYAKAWFEKADRDLRLTELSLAEGDDFSDMACFHAQQCAEKYLKGFLASHRKDFPFSHLLNHLLALCREIDEEFAGIEDSVMELQEYSTSVRYPADEFGEPSPRAARTAFDRPRQIRDFVRRKANL